MTADFKRDALIKIHVPSLPLYALLLSLTDKPFQKLKTCYLEKWVQRRGSDSEWAGLLHSGGSEAFYLSSAGASHYLPHFFPFIMLAVYASFYHQVEIALSNTEYFLHKTSCKFNSIFWKWWLLSEDSIHMLVDNLAEASYLQGTVWPGCETDYNLNKWQENTIKPCA